MVKILYSSECNLYIQYNTTITITITTTITSIFLGS